VVAAALVATAVVVVASRRDDGWSIDAPGSSNELVADDRTVCGTNQDDVVFCLDGADGDEIFHDALVQRGQALAIADLLAGRRAAVEQAAGRGDLLADPAAHPGPVPLSRRTMRPGLGGFLRG
jgi:hypothetical protein